MIAIIDYGMGNLRSVQKGFEKVGHQAKVTSSAAEIAQGVLGAVRRHAGEHPQSDDITIVTLCRLK